MSDYDLPGLTRHNVLAPEGTVLPEPVDLRGRVSEQTERQREPSCEKCGSAHVQVRYHVGANYWGDATHCATGDYRQGVSFDREEHLHFTCETCRYDWTGAVLASSVAPGEQ